MIDVRGRSSDKINRARVELELRRSIRPLIVVLIGAAVGLAITVYIASNLSPTFLAKTNTYRFAVDSATGVVPGSQEIRFKGIPVGVIKDVKVEGSGAVITGSFKRSYGPIYRNARAQLRPSTPLMDTYLDITDRGTEAAGKLGAGTLASSQTKTSVNVADVLNVFRSRTRGHLGALLDNLGHGLQDGGAQLRASIVELNPLVVVAGKITRQLARREQVTKRLVHNTSSLMGTLAGRDRDLRGMVSDTGSALSGLQASRTDLDATIRELPLLVAQLDTSMRALGGVLGDVDGAATALRPVTSRVSSALQTVRKLNTSAAPAVRALGTPVRKLVPFSESLRPLSADLRTTVTSVLPHTPVLNRTVRDLVDCEKGIKGFFQWTASLGKFGDARGPVPRGNLAAGVQSLSLSSPFEAALPTCAPGKPMGPGIPTDKDKS
jgi:phospholipid/cholesterol/gamma-HCH transport system substrate-binding protein